uniref:Uncharacterized protein n=1 Tax=Vespula pensylvanica TaxID=30213 RepID=A0A834U3K5_VESPE|nr:hypothetical protein H0235_012002 [Vespula pensylvanica]
MVVEVEEEKEEEKEEEEEEEEEKEGEREGEVSSLCTPLNSQREVKSVRPRPSVTTLKRTHQFTSLLLTGKLTPQIHKYDNAVYPGVRSRIGGEVGEVEDQPGNWCSLRNITLARSHSCWKLRVLTIASAYLPETALSAAYRKQRETRIQCEIAGIRR